jgi:hypothetical protein
LIRIESYAFQGSSLKSLVIPRNVEILGSSCFFDCPSLSSISFESDSQLKRLDEGALQELSLQVAIPLPIPSTVVFIASEAIDDPFQISLTNSGFCPEFERWQFVNSLSLVLDFRRIRRFGSGLPSISECLFDLSGFREGLELSEQDGISTRLYHGSGEEIEIVVKSASDALSCETGHGKKVRENLMNLRHPCIAGLIGIVRSSSFPGLKIVRNHAGSYSLPKVISESPGWWTPTTKAKAVIGIVLALQYAHSLGLLHGHLTANNVIFDGAGTIQITDFYLNGFGAVKGSEGTQGDGGGFSGEGWTVKCDLRGF